MWRPVHCLDAQHLPGGNVGRRCSLASHDDDQLAFVFGQLCDMHRHSGNAQDAAKDALLTCEAATEIDRFLVAHLLDGVDRHAINTPARKPALVPQVNDEKVLRRHPSCIESVIKQQTLAIAADDKAQYAQHRRPTKRDVFLATMEQIVPWAALCEVIEPHHPKAGNGRPQVGLEPMLCMHFVQHWFKLADAAREDALLDSTALRRFASIDLGRERVPDATTLLKFRRPLEKHKLGEAMAPIAKLRALVVPQEP